MVVGSNVFSPTSGQPTIYDYNDEVLHIIHSTISNDELIILLNFIGENIK